MPAGTRISVRDVVLCWREYRDVGRIAAALRVSKEAISAALDYYEQHAAEIDASIRQDEEAGEPIEREHPGALRISS